MPTSTNYSRLMCANRVEDAPAFIKCPEDSKSADFKHIIRAIAIILKLQAGKLLDEREDFKSHGGSYTANLI